MSANITLSELHALVQDMEQRQQRQLDTIWKILTTTFVFFMQAGFALLENGSVRSKNSHSILIKNLLDTCVGAMMFYLFGYAIAFGTDGEGHIVAGEKYYAGRLGDDPGVINDWSFAFAFAVTAATIVSGSLAERVKIRAYIAFSATMSGFIYPIVVSWTWGDGWLRSIGFVDFAGAGVVHLTGGIAGLVGTLVVGPRLGRFGSVNSLNDTTDRWVRKANIIYEDDEEKQELIDQIAANRFHERFPLKLRNYLNRYDTEGMKAHNVPFVVLGVLILWIGWIMFNAGSSLGIHTEEQ